MKNFITIELKIAHVISKTINTYNDEFIGMDILVISNYLEECIFEKDKGDNFEYVKANEESKYSYTDYHAIIVDFRNLEDSFDKMINWEDILRAFFYGTIIVILISEEGFRSSFLTLNIIVGFEIKIKKERGKNIIRELKQDDFLRSYAKKLSGYSVVIDNSGENDEFYIETLHNNVILTNPIEPIAVAENTRKVLGGVIDFESNILAILPVLNVSKYDELKILYDFIKKLKPKGGIESVKFRDLIKEVPLFDELELRKNLESYKNQTDKINKKLSQYSKFKSILYLKGDKLVDSVTLVLKEMGLKTLRKDIKEEDFWILDEERNKIIICEVKGVKKNCTRKHINDLDNHREMNGLKEDFPALLIINSFAEAKNLKSKDQDISPDIIKKAINNNILVIRTLDLLYAFDLIKAKKIKLSKFIEALKSERGWIRIINEKIVIKKN